MMLGLYLAFWLITSVLGLVMFAMNLVDTEFGRFGSKEEARRDTTYHAFGLTAWAVWPLWLACVGAYDAARTWKAARLWPFPVRGSR